MVIEVSEVERGSTGETYKSESEVMVNSYARGDIVRFENGQRLRSARPGAMKMKLNLGQVPKVAILSLSNG